MRFNSSHSFVFALSACFLCACSGGSSQAIAKLDAPSDMAALVPANSTLYLHFSSLDDVNDLSALLVSEIGADFDPGALLRQTLADAMDDEWMESGLPIGIAGDPALLMSGRSYIQSLIVPARNVDKLRGGIRGAVGNAAASVEGDYVGIPQSETYGLGLSSQLSTQGLLEGDISLRLDLQTLVSGLRPMIDAGLDAIPALLNNPDFAAPNEDPDIESASEEIIAGYISALRSFLDSSEQLDLALGVEGNQLSMTIELKVLEGSLMANFDAGSRADIRSLAGYLDPESKLTQLIGVDALALLDFSDAFFVRMLQSYPPVIQGMFDAGREDFKELLELIQGALACNTYFDPNGLRGTYFVASRNTDELIEKMGLLMSNKSLGAVGVAGHEVEQIEVRGLQVVRHKFDLDFEKLGDLVSEQAQMKGVDFNKTMQAMYGTDGVQISIAAMDGIVALVGGGDDEFHENALETFARGPGKLSKELERSVGAVESSPTAFVFQMDVPQYLHGLLSNYGVLELMPGHLNFEALGEHSTSLWTHGSIENRIWNVQMRADLPELALALKSMGN